MANATTPARSRFLGNAVALAIGAGIVAGLGAWFWNARGRWASDLAQAQGAAATQPAPALGTAVTTTATTARVLGPAPTAPELAGQWPWFRGPAAGAAAVQAPPTDFDGASGRGRRWKTTVPLPAPNSPVVWGHRVFLSGASATERAVFCFDADTGALLWRGDVTSPAAPDAEPPTISPETSFAAPTVATDGRRVCALFATGDLACFDCDGHRCWTLALGPLDNTYGHSTSLLMAGDLLLVQLDQADAEAGKSALLGLDLASGRTVYRTPRPVGASWASPILVDTPAGRQLITAAKPWVIAYDPATGKEIWRAGDIGDDLAPSPAYSDGTVFVASPNTHVLAIATGGKGDVTASQIRWKVEEDIPDICSPVAGKGLLWLPAGELCCYQVADGKKLWSQDLKSAFSASPVIVGDKLYLIDDKGAVFILAAADKYAELGRAAVGEEVMATPAFAPGRMYVRGKSSLFCFESKTGNAR